jgi:hypothetical protein
MDGSARALLQQLVVDRLHVKVSRDRAYSPWLEVLFCLQTWRSSCLCQSGRRRRLTAFASAAVGYPDSTSLLDRSGGGRRVG